MEKKEKLLRSILTAATVLLLVLLAWQCLDIYLVGNSPANLDENGLYIQKVYRAEDVIARLNGLRIWAIGYLALLVVACIMIPGTAGKGSAVAMEPDNRLYLDTLTAIENGGTTYRQQAGNFRGFAMGGSSLASLCLCYFLQMFCCRIRCC